MQTGNFLIDVKNDFMIIRAMNVRFENYNIRILDVLNHAPMISLLFTLKNKIHLTIISV